MKVNCAALPSELLESELFGFERGAFTGAIQHKPGKFEFANHGTMFLDEISEMQLPLQAKLLQVLQDGEFARLGGRNDVRVDVRIVAATNRDLERAVADGQFREDLFFRLNVVCITLPPLRQRRDEIPVLTRALPDAVLACTTTSRRIALAADTLRLFVEYDWPGNVRELENLIKRAVVLGTDESIRRELAEAIAGRILRVRAHPRAAVAPGTGGAGRGGCAGGASAGGAGAGARARGGRDAGAAHRVVEGHRTPCRAGSGAGADLPHAAADALEPPGSRRDPRHQLQGAALQDQGSGAGQGVVMTSDPFLREDFRVLTPEAFDFVLNNELKRAVRSQNFLTLLLVEPMPTDPERVPPSEVLREVARLVSREVRETDLLSQTDGRPALGRPARRRSQQLDAGGRSPRVAARALRVPYAGRPRSRCGDLSDSRGRRGDAAPCRRNAPGSPAPR